MKCPTDNATLVMSERSGIEIDYCPECRGVWLDRGELDKIIDRSQGTAPAAAPSAPGYPPQPTYAQPTQHEYRQQPASGQPAYPYRKKKENWLSELFD
ncbi:TFIIB-type zinc ribbon-containing protein [Leifsonia poae]|uniref:Transcription factor zinc-finger domain-containing protein n=1 Tax=Leifsonia poae TaxID=110933 RepID=A0A9W6M0Z7_9MICO|nr:zf-TFIIB domain-containing protein [Leifsonia poae]GLJ77923.1 hypothetical protein GCM10017584_34970 [Leifsonia poae]